MLMDNLGKKNNDLTSRPNPGIMVSKGNHMESSPNGRTIQVSEIW